MSRTSRSTKNDYVPTDYDDLVKYYITGEKSLCCSIIRTMMPHATPDELLELPQAVAERCVAKKVISLYDSTKANFGGVIYFVTRSIVSNHLDRKSRNPLTGLNGGYLSSSDPDDGTFEPGVYSLDRLFGSPTPDYDNQIDARSILSDLFSWARELHEAPRHKRDESLYPMLQLMAEEQDAKEMAPKLGVTTSTIANWTQVIRQKAVEIATERGYLTPA